MISAAQSACLHARGTLLQQLGHTSGAAAAVSAAQGCAGEPGACCCLTVCYLMCTRITAEVCGFELHRLAA